MQTKTITARLATIAADAEREGWDPESALVDTITAQDKKDGAAALVADTEAALLDRLNAHAVRIAAVLNNAPRGTLAALVKATAPKVGKGQDATRKAISRLRDTGLLMVAYKDADPLTLNAYANGATAEDMAAALSGEVSPLTTKTRAAKPEGNSAKTPEEKDAALLERILKTIRDMDADRLERFDASIREVIVPAIRAAYDERMTVAIVEDALADEEDIAS